MLKLFDLAIALLDAFDRDNRRWARNVEHVLMWPINAMITHVVGPVVARVGRPRGTVVDGFGFVPHVETTGHHAADGVCTIVDADWTPLDDFDRALIIDAVRQLAAERAAVPA